MGKYKAAPGSGTLAEKGNIVPGSGALALGKLGRSGLATSCCVNGDVRTCHGEFH